MRNWNHGVLKVLPIEPQMTVPRMNKKKYAYFGSGLRIQAKIRWNKQVNEKNTNKKIINFRYRSFYTSHRFSVHIHNTLTHSRFVILLGYLYADFMYSHRTIFIETGARTELCYMRVHVHVHERMSVSKVMQTVGVCVCA